MTSQKFGQSGFTMWEGAVVLGIIGMLFTFLMKLGPTYLEDHGISGTFDNVHEQLAGKDLYEIDNAAIKKTIGKYFEVDMVSDEVFKQIEIKRESGKVLLMLNYEIRKPLMGNVDVVMNFSHEVDLAAPLAK
jgi:hypothetical protein